MQDLQVMLLYDCSQGRDARTRWLPRVALAETNTPSMVWIQEQRPSLSRSHQRTHSGLASLLQRLVPFLDEIAGERMRWLKQGRS